MTDGRCSPNHIQWAYDTYMYANVTATSMMERHPQASWFMLSADYAFGKNMARDAMAVVKQNGRSEERRAGKECVRRVDLGGRRIMKKKKTLKSILDAHNEK